MPPSEEYECFNCGAEVTAEERQRVRERFDTSLGPSVQSTMCFKCADNYEPGDNYYEGLAEKRQAEGWT